MNKILAWAALLPPTCLTIASLAQTATVTTTVNGGASATIAPGGVVTIAVQLSHDKSSVAGIEGGTIIDGNAGVGGNLVTTLSPGPTMTFGSFLGGSRVGADFASVSPLFPSWIPIPPFGQNPMPIWQYEITGLIPGTYWINWVAPATAQNVRLFASPTPTGFVESQTTYTGATITVTPAPGTLAIAAAAAVVCTAAGGRRRR